MRRLLQHPQRLNRTALPRETLDIGKTGRSQPFAQSRIGQQLVQPISNRRRARRIDQQCGLAGNLRERGGCRRQHRSTASLRLEYRKAKTLVKRGKCENQRTAQ